MLYRKPVILDMKYVKRKVFKFFQNKFPIIPDSWITGLCTLLKDQETCVMKGVLGHSIKQ